MEPTKPPRATRADVAKRAGVSTTVVSHALGGRAELVADKTRERVQRIADELGYRPNALARGLKSGSSALIGLLAPDISNSFFASLSRAVEQEAFKQKHLLLVADSAEDPEREQHYIESFIDLRVTGLIVVGNASGATSQGPLARLKDSGITVVDLDRSRDTAQSRSVMVDNVGGAATATRHLLIHGRRNLLLLGGPAGVSTAEERLQGMEGECRMEPEGSLAWSIRRGDFSVAAGYTQTMAHLRGGNRPDGIIASSDLQALGAIRACHDLNIAMPEDVAIIGFDGIAEGALTTPSLSTVAQPVQEIARRAVQAIFDDEASLRTDRLETELIRRASCGCVDGPFTVAP